MKTLFLICFSAFFSFTSLAQSRKDSLSITVFPYDSYSENILEHAKVSIYEADSVTCLADSLRGIYNYAGGDSGERSWLAGFRGTFPKRAGYVVKVSCAGYDGQDEFVLAPKSRRAEGMSKRFYLFKSQTRDLGEASVTASKILMVMKGDTIVYNATAFKLAEGSMLDNLVRNLPGVKLDNDGRITVNGEFVSSLLVNGKDFFSGDPKIALNNLPAYTVNKIKVYHKNPEAWRNEERTEEERKKDPLVMDVALKRDYAQGWLANFEVAGGSHLKGGFDEVWLARLFAMRFTNHSQLALFANANNMNDYNAPASKGEWRKPEVGAGDKKTYMGGVNLSVDGKKKRGEFNTSLQAMRQTTSNEQRTTQVSYLPAGDVTSLSRSESQQGLTNVKWDARFNVPKELWPEVKMNAYYTHNAVTSASLSKEYEGSGEGMGSFYALPGSAEWEQALLYQREQQGDSHLNDWGGEVSLGSGWRIARTDRTTQSLSYNASFSYNKQDHDEFTADRISYAPSSTAATAVSEDRQQTMPARAYHYGAGVKYSLTARKLYWTEFYLSYNFSQDFNSGRRDLLTRDNSNLEQTQALSSDSASFVKSLGETLASSASWLTDLANSYHTTRLTATHSLSAYVHHSFKKKASIEFTLPLAFYRRRINDFRNLSPAHLVKHDVTFSPEVLFSLKLTKKIKPAIGYRRTETLPELLQMLPVRDSSDPLIVSLGNENLGKSTGHTLWLTSLTKWSDEAGRSHNTRLNLSWEKTNNLISTARIYNRTTGVTTYQPLGIDGNWQAAVGGWYMQDVDKKKHLYLSFQPSYRFLHSVDFSSESTSEALSRMAVDNHSLNGELRLDYRINSLHLGAKAQVNWTKLKSDSPTFTTTDYTEYSYGLTLTTPLVWGIDLDTDLMAYCRRGYADTSMNTTDWVWNASLSKAFGRRKEWLVRAMGFDILSQLSNVRKVMTAQGRTETWYNTIPSYATLHIVYRLDIKPKKH